jgi:ComF family protein
LPADLPGDVIAAYAYAFPVDRLVQRFKFGGDLTLGRWLGERLAECVAGEPRPDLLVAPPLAARRLRERGFNQALQLASCVGRAIHVPVDRDPLTRVRETSSQAGLGRAARRQNLRGAFHCTRDLRGMRVALVDDVFTTGATAEAIADVLRDAGASDVRTWVVARTPDPSGD